MTVRRPLRIALGWLSLAIASSSNAQQIGPSDQLQERRGRFEFELSKPALTSAGIFDAKGRLVCSLWSLKTLEAGKHSGQWFYRDQFDRPVPGTGYELRVIANRGSYENVAIIGNTGNDRPTHTPGYMQSVAVDAEGSIYTANYWDEAGADFKKWDWQGKSVYDADFQIRNGDPNGGPYAIAVDDTFLYCSVGGWDRPPYNSRQQIQRFRLRDGKPEPFTEAAENQGHIQLHEWPEKRLPRGVQAKDAELMKMPLRALAVGGERLYVCDALEGKIRIFHKGTGKPLGEFRVPLPTAIAVGPDGRVWVGHEHRKVTAFDADGGKGSLMIEDLSDVGSLAIGPEGRLYVADTGDARVKIYETDDGGARIVDFFGQKAKPGDSEADHFHSLLGVAVDSKGNLATIQKLPMGGACLAHWSPDFKLQWEHRGLEFVSLGTYSRESPDDFISLTYHRYHLNRSASPPRAEYRGCLLSEDSKYKADVHGVPRLVKLGDATFYYTAQGDGMQVFRLEGKAFRPAAMVGGRAPSPEGKVDLKGPLGQWAWSDRNRDGKVQAGEVVWFRKPGQGKYSVFGINVDERGNLILCDQETRSIKELPMLGLDEHGNPRYDWRSERVIVPRDSSMARLTPLMAVRADDGRLYAFCRSETWPQPKDGEGAWMAGWVVSSYSRVGELLWATPLPQMCVGLDYVPGGGVLLGWYEKAHVYHYNADGLLIGTAVPGAVAGGTTGYLDNTAALAANRDPRDHLIDVFTSDNYLYRILWYRLDDRKIETIRGAIVDAGPSANR
ncbi:hypothetical protein [Singulisphaera sp. PoT]|uniref:hypothetical protein n=1 Tax=Singulisphaera sp. PoT TaxID=3411797 RepID=UPI003BF56752